MKSLLEAIQTRVERLDTALVDRVRVVTILVFALGCGVVLRAQLFSRAEEPLSFPELAAASVPLEQGAAAPVVSASPEAAPDIPVEAGGDALPGTAPFAISASSSEAATAQPEPFILSARAALVTRGPALYAVRYQKSADERLPIASLTKLMTATVVVEQGMLGDALTVNREAVRTEGVAGNLVVGETLLVADALRIMLIVSSNDAAAALEEYFKEQGVDLVALMNEKAEVLGMANTHFANVSGLEGEGHYSTARDLAALTAYSLQHRLIWEILSYTSATVKSTDGRFTHRLVSNNELLQKGAANVQAGKTGYTEQALGCMISVLEDGSIVVVLGSKDRGGETERLISVLSHD